MIISVFSDGGKKDKIAELYDTKNEKKCKEILEALEQESCEDCISREYILSKAYAYGNGLEPEGYCVEVEDIQQAPSVQPKVMTGHWFYKNGIRYCEFCGASNSTAYDSYCPNCGAKMTESEEVKK